MAEELDQLAEIRAARSRLDEQELALIERARYAGATWSQVGAALGLASRQAAEQRRRRLAAAVEARCREADRAWGPDIAAIRAAMSNLHRWILLDRHWDSRFPRAALTHVTVATALQAAPGALYALAQHALTDLAESGLQRLPAPVQMEAAALRESLSTKR
ncbi:hypothetical protein [Actinoplanes sp. GCM10030250]|uniref:hypothetical protein n=1 Tax=Actinoplanes sp. GCM10030250 TaxID=3273376 RepID=UPI00361784C3